MHTPSLSLARTLPPPWSEKGPTVTMNKRTKVLLAAAVTVPLALGTAGTAYATHFQDRALPGSTLGGVSVAGMTRADLADPSAARRGCRGHAHGHHQRTALPTSATPSTSRPPWTPCSTPTTPGRRTRRRWSRRATSAQSCTRMPRRPTRSPPSWSGRRARLAPTRPSSSRRAGPRSWSTPRRPVRTVTRGTLHDVAASAARELSSTTTTVKFVTTVPTVTTAAAQQVADRANALVALPVTVSDGEEKHSPSAKTRASWVTIPTTDGAPGTPTVDAAKLRSWVAARAKDAKVDRRRPALRRLRGHRPGGQGHPARRPGRVQRSRARPGRGRRGPGGRAVLGRLRVHEGPGILDGAPESRPGRRTSPTRRPTARSGSTSTSAARR